MDSSNRVHLFTSLFRGREDAYGANGNRCVRRTLTDEVILRHLRGEQRLGIYPLLPDNTVYFAVVDIDEPDLDAVQSYLDAAQSCDIPTYLEASKAKGFHLWHFFAEPVLAEKARELARQILRDANLTAKTEIFPKQSMLLTPESVGNYINLPLFGEDVRNGRTMFLNSVFQPYTDQWAFLASVEKITRDQLEGIIERNHINQDEIAAPEGNIEAGIGAGDYSDMAPCVKKMMKGVARGCRNTIGFTLAKHFRVQKGLPEEATLAILLLWNRRNEPPLADRDIQVIVRSVYNGRAGRGYTSWGCEDKLIEPFCDRDNCPFFKPKKEQSKITGSDTYFKGKAFIPKRLADAIMKENRFIYTTGQLYRYADGVYLPDGRRFAEVEAQKRLGEGSRQNRTAEAIYYIQVASCAENSELNKGLGVINLRNGLLDWRGGRLISHDPDYISSIRIPVEYDPQARCQIVDYFLATTLPPDCIQLAEEIFGYCLIPDTRFEKAFMLAGSGANGKSTFLTLLEAFIGSHNVSKIPLQELSENRFKRADVFGKLVNLFADLDAKSVESSSYFKAVVSGDMIDAERKHQDPFYFRPFSRLVYSANEIPRSKDRSFAYYRRWCIIPFSKQFIGADADRSLAAKLTQPGELSGLLNRALRGLKRIFENESFTESETVKNALEDYRRQNDTVVAFASERCEFVPEGEIGRKELYAAYVNYCENEGFRAASRNACYNRVRAYPHVGEKKGEDDRCFTGVRLRGR